MRSYAGSRADPRTMQLHAPWEVRWTASGPVGVLLPLSFAAQILARRHPARRTSMTTDLSFLKELGIQGTNSGAYDGRWLACTGAMLESTNPATGEPIARVQQATRREYEQCVAA